MLILFSVYHSGLGLVEPIPSRITANSAKGAIAYASMSCIVGSHLLPTAMLQLPRRSSGEEFSGASRGEVSPRPALGMSDVRRAVGPATCQHSLL